MENQKIKIKKYRKFVFSNGKITIFCQKCRHLTRELLKDVLHAHINLQNIVTVKLSHRTLHMIHPRDALLPLLDVRFDPGDKLQSKRRESFEQSCRRRNGMESWNIDRTGRERVSGGGGGRGGGTKGVRVLAARARNKFL